LAESGSLVIEIGNAWDKGLPTMSTLPLETLISIKNELDLHVCQQFIWQNPSKLPGPANWVNRHRIRVKDSFTHIWWFSKTPWPKANNRNVLQPYTAAMEKLLKTQNYNQGARPSGHNMGSGFLTRNEGSIPSSVISMANSAESKSYKEWCSQIDVPRHPARMPVGLAKFFIEFLTSEGDLVLDPFGGSNTTGFSAEALNRRWISVERDANYAKGSAGRFGLDFANEALGRIVKNA
jgi:DNA modification methylase